MVVKVKLSSIRNLSIIWAIKNTTFFYQWIARSSHGRVGVNGPRTIALQLVEEGLNTALGAYRDIPMVMNGPNAITIENTQEQEHVTLRVAQVQVKQGAKYQKVIHSVKVEIRGRGVSFNLCSRVRHVI